MFAPRSTADDLKGTARQFLSSLRDSQYGVVWDQLITPEAAQFLAAALFPVNMYRQNRTEALFTPISASGTTTTLDRAYALAFSQDTDQARTGFLQGVANVIRQRRWSEFRDSDMRAFLVDSFAVIVGDTPGGPLIIPFLRDGSNQYRVDFEAMTAFSMEIPASDLFQIGVVALSQDRRDSALYYFELASYMGALYERVRRTMSEHFIVQLVVTTRRKEEIQEQIRYTSLAKEHVHRLLEGPGSDASDIDLSRMMPELFSGYQNIIDTEITSKDILHIFDLDDATLRESVAAILTGVDPVAAQREARKPHSAAEIADMELPFLHNGATYYLCMPFKSGREIRSSTVPVYVAYQIIRPFLFFPKNGIVVFVSAKPCSQPLMNYIKQARATFGFPIEVVQERELAALLKIHGMLPST